MVAAIELVDGHESSKTLQFVVVTAHIVASAFSKAWADFIQLKATRCKVGQTSLAISERMLGEVGSSKDDVVVDMLGLALLSW